MTISLASTLPSANLIGICCGIVLSKFPGDSQSTRRYFVLDPNFPTKKLTFHFTSPITTSKIKKIQNSSLYMLASSQQLSFPYLNCDNLSLTSSGPNRLAIYDQLNHMPT